MDQMTTTQKLLLATAWVDNHLAEAEANLLRQLLAAQGIAADTVEHILKSEPPPLADLLVQLPGQQTREEVMREVLRMCFSDGVLEIEEFDLIERIAQHLKLTTEVLERIRTEVSEE